MQVAVLGIDLGKNSCSIIGLNGTGEVVLRRRMRRDTLVTPGVLAATVHRCHGALLRSSSSGASARGSGPQHSADVAGVRVALCEGAEER